MPCLGLLLLFNISLAQMPPIPKPSPREHLRLIWFGNTGGVSGQLRAHQAPELLYKDPEIQLEGLAEGPRAFAQAGRIFFKRGGLSIQEFREFLSAAPYRRSQVRALPLAQSVREWIFELPDGPALPRILSSKRGFRAAQGRLLRFINQKGEALMALELPGCVAEEPLNPNPYSWELRFLFEGRIGEGRFFSLSRPLHEGARRLSFIKRLRAEQPERTLILAAGEDLEDFSYIQTGSPDRQRLNSWSSFREMGLSAIAPGAAEIAFGLNRLQREAQESGVEVLGANIEGEPPFAGWSLKSFGPLKILLVGFLNPEMREADRLRALGAQRILRPEMGPALRWAQERLGRRPDLTLAFGHLPPEARARLTSAPEAPDLILGDFSLQGLQPSRVLLPDIQQGGVLPIVQSGVGRLGLLDIIFEAQEQGWRPRSLESQALPVLGEEPPALKLLEQIQKVRQKSFQPAQRLLLPDQGPAIAGDPQLSALFEADPWTKRMRAAGATLRPRVSARLWQNLLSNLLRRRFSAEVVILPELELQQSFLGEISRLEAIINIPIPGDVVLLSLKAKGLKTLLKHRDRAQLQVTGLVSGDPPKILGRPLDERERYRVLSTEALWRDPRFEKVFEGAWLESLEEKHLKVRDLLIQEMEHLTEQEPEQIPELLRPLGEERVRRWVLDIKELSFETSTYSNHGPQGPYADVKESRVSTAQNVSFSAQGDISLRRESPRLDWVNQIHGAFAEARYEEAPTQETLDELQLSTELQLHSLDLLIGTPYSSLSFATEFTPTDENPRKKRGEAAVGLLWSGEFIKQARLASVMARDFAEEISDPELGFLAQLEISRELEKLEWYGELEGRYYIPEIGEDSETELGAIFRLRSGLDLPVVGGFGVGIFLDLFAYRGQVEGAHDPSASLMSGLRLKYDRVWKP